MRDIGCSSGYVGCRPDIKEMPSKGTKKMGAKTSKRYEIEDVAKKLKDGEFKKVIFMVS